MFKRSVEETLNDVLMFSLVHNNIFSVDNMTDKEVRESLIDDLLLITMMEKEEKVTIDFNQHKLFRWLKPLQHGRVYEQMAHPEISGLIERKNGQIRIKDQKEILQAAMDYCGHWWEGYDIPNEPGIFTMNREVVDEQIEAAGGFDNFIDGLAKTLHAELMDTEATVPVSKTLQ